MAKKSRLRKSFGKLFATSSTKRRSMPGASSWEVQTDADGNKLCRECGKPTPNKRKTFCSPECVHDWRMKTSTSYVRKCVYARDHGVCAVCGLDTMDLKRRLLARRRRGIGNYTALLDRLGILHRRTYWDADHIVPVCHGGGLTGLDNYQTLCVWCHKQKTKTDRERKWSRRVK